MKTALITGGAGFIAHHVVKYLLDKTDWNLICLDRLDFSGNLNRLYDVLQSFTPEQRSRVKIVWHDLKAEISPLTSKMIGSDVNYVLHLAAGSHVDRSIEYPMEFVMDNVVGTGNLLQWSRTLPNLEQFVYFSTDEIFGPAPGNVAYKEYDRYNSTNPYSASKAGGEELAVAFRNTYKMPIIVTHTMNVFGERQHPEKFIPLCIRRVANGEKISIHANAQKTKAGSRHYIHASDVADGLYFLLIQPSTSLVGEGANQCPKYNLVGPEEWDNYELARLIATIQKKPLQAELVDFHSSRPGHDLRYALDGGRLKALGWEPREKVSVRMEQVVSWFLSHPEWLKV